MDEKSKKKLFSYMDDEDLNFTEDDRNSTFNKIRQRGQQKGSLFPEKMRRHLGPVLGSVVVIMLAIGILIPNLFANNDMNSQNAQQQTSRHKELSFSALLIGENPVTRRSDFTVLMTYNSQDNSINLVPISRDAYVDIYNAEGEIISKDKLTHAYAYNTAPIPVVKTVSNLFDMPIDYYATVQVKDFFKALGISEDEEQQETILKQEIGDVLQSLSFSQFQTLLTESETNIPNDVYSQFKAEQKTSEAIRVIEMEEGVEDKFIDGIYYTEIDPAVLESTRDRLQQHLGEEK
ncbi:LCP family protein [Oceanobacillus kapialis]|uniref:LCP family glycopolymer transferase n=1 Tax=Oceanobacillus kapialis TaxID=481353 RepID=UPI00384FEF14